MPTLLLVEDDPALQFTIQTALEEQGYAVDAVSTTGAAIERLSDAAYPIVISDILIVGATTDDRHTRSSPIISIAMYMSFKLPAIVISCTGYVSCPSSIQMPLAPRE